MRTLLENLLIENLSIDKNKWRAAKIKIYFV